MNKYIKCPVCGREFQRITIKHIKLHGFESKEEFMNIFKLSKLNSDYDSSKRSSCAKESYTEEMRENARLNGKRNLIAYNKSQWSSEKREKRSNDFKKLLKDEKFQKKAADNRTGSHSETRSESMKQKWLDDEYALKVITNSHKSLAGLKSYDNGFFRSSWESKLASNLSELGIKFEYESLTFNYEFEDKMRRYIPDFYLPDYKVIIEVKNDSLINSDLTIAKRNAIPNEYKYLILGKKDIFDNFNKIWNTVVEGATIIES